MKKYDYLLSIIIAAGIIFIFIGIKVLSNTAAPAVGVFSAIFKILGGLALAYAFLQRLVLVFTDKDRRKLHIRFLLAYFGIGLSFLFFYLQSESFMEKYQSTRTADSWHASFEKSFFILSASFMFISGLYTLFVELAYRNMRRSGFVDYRRIKFSAKAAIIISIFLCTVFAINYIAAEKNSMKDMTINKIYTAQDFTLNLVKNLNADLSVIGFYPSGNPTGDEIFRLLEQLEDADDNSHLELIRVDADLEPDLASEYGVRNNGVIKFESGENNKQVRIDLDCAVPHDSTRIDACKEPMNNMEKNFVEAIIETTTEKRTVYFTTGHGEKTYDMDNQGFGLYIIKNQLGVSNFTVKKLPARGESNALINGVPDDADLLFIPGPVAPFDPIELNALAEYLVSGGKVIAFVDPEATENNLNILFNHFNFKLDFINAATSEVEINQELAIQFPCLSQVYGQGFSAAEQDIECLIPGLVSNNPNYCANGHPLLPLVHNFKDHMTVEQFKNLARENPGSLVGFFSPTIGAFKTIDENLETPYIIKYPIVSRNDSWMELNLDGRYNEEFEVKQAYNHAVAIELDPALVVEEDETSQSDEEITEEITEESTDDGGAVEETAEEDALPDEEAETDDSNVEENEEESNFSLDMNYETEADSIELPEITKEFSGKLFVYADSDLITDLWIQRSSLNLDLVSETVKWLMDEGELQGFVPRAEIEDPELIPTPRQENFVFYFSIIFFPATLLIGGIVFWSFRKKKTQKIISEIRSKEN